jgi:hypothetical protein
VDLDRPDVGLDFSPLGGSFSALRAMINVAVGYVCTSRYFSFMCLSRSAIPVLRFASGTVMLTLPLSSATASSVVVPSIFSPAGPEH